MIVIGTRLSARSEAAMCAARQVGVEKADALVAETLEPAPAPQDARPRTIADPIYHFVACIYSSSFHLS